MFKVFGMMKGISSTTFEQIFHTEEYAIAVARELEKEGFDTDIVEVPKDEQLTFDLEDESGD